MPKLEGHFKTYEEALAWLGRRVAAVWESQAVGEPIGAEPAVDERLIQCIWNDGLLAGRSLATLTGKSLSIVHPGDWNREAGPDFQRAEILIDGEHLKGDVEIHVRSSDWTGHGHNRNFDYNGVILHVFLECGDDRRHDVLHNGRRIERLHLGPFLEPDLESLRQAMAQDDYAPGGPPRHGRCRQAIEMLDVDTLVEILDLAGDRRLDEKAGRFAAQLGGEPLDQVFYQALMSALGHKSGKALYFLLAKRAPIAELADHAADCPPAERLRLIEAILYHVANLVPHHDDRPDSLDEPTQAYLNELNRQWCRVAPYFADRIIPPTRRWYAGIRPVNFPCRRLAGIAHVVAGRLDRGVVASILDRFWGSMPARADVKSVRKMANRLAGALSVDIDHYWSRRYVWGGKLAAHAQCLIGEGQARSVLFNAVLPMALLNAREEGSEEREAAVRAVWRCFPRLPENQVVRLMRERLFGEDDRLAGLFTTEHRNQALFQIFNDCCNNRLADCSQCTLVHSESGTAQ